MIKKMVLGVVLAGLIGVLVFGAVNRTLARWDFGDGGYGGERRGHSGGNQGYGSLDQSDPGSGGQRRGQGGGNEGYGSSGQRRGPGGGNQGHDGPAQGSRGDAGQPRLAVEWLTLTGTVTSVDETTLKVNVTDTTTVEVANRAWWYAQSQGFAVAPGDQISLYGFYEGEWFEAGRITNVTSGASVTLRDETGRPMWAGRSNW